MTIWQGLALGLTLAGAGAIGAAVVVLAIDEVSKLVAWMRRTLR